MITIERVPRKPNEAARSRGVDTVVSCARVQRASLDGGMADSLCRTPEIVVQQSAEAFASSNGCVVVSRLRRRCEQPTVEALVAALKMIVLDEFFSRRAAGGARRAARACSSTRS
jgi:hypothetical protein